MIFISDNCLNSQSECQKKLDNMNGQQNVTNCDYVKSEGKIPEPSTSYSKKEFDFILILLFSD